MQISDLTPAALLTDPDRALQIWSQLEKFRAEKQNFYALLRELGDLFCEGPTISSDGVSRALRLHQHVRPVFRALERDYSDWMADAGAPASTLDNPRVLCEYIGLYYYRIVAQSWTAKNALWAIMKDAATLAGNPTSEQIRSKLPVEIWRDAIKRE